MTTTRDDGMNIETARQEAAGILRGLGRLLIMDDPNMPAPNERLKKARHFERVSDALDPTSDQIGAFQEWTANLDYLLGLINCSGQPWHRFDRLTGE